jgi:hypothetical protein
MLRVVACSGFFFALGARPALADPPVAVTLMRPVPINGGEAQPHTVSGVPEPVQPVSYSARAIPALEPVYRGQAADVPQAPPPPPPPPPGMPAVQEDPFNCGQILNENPQPLPVNRGGAPGLFGIPLFVAPPGGRAPFQSDHAFDYFISPVSNPLRFEDPRSLTELRPVFIYNWTPHSNYPYQGGTIGYFGTQLRLAITERFSVVINDLGFIWQNPRPNITDLQPHTGFAEFHLGPKYTFIRSESTGTVVAAGLNFDIPAGSHNVAQDTGTLSLTPYITGAQKICTPIGNFNAMATFGFAASVNHERSDYFFNSYHLDYDIPCCCHKLFPLVELNWYHYTNNGNSRNLNFEGTDLFNFGSNSVAGLNYLRMAFGARYVPFQWLQVGSAFEIPLTPSASSRDIERFRLTFDVIFRY